MLRNKISFAVHHCARNRLPVQTVFLLCLPLPSPLSPFVFASSIEVRPSQWRFMVALKYARYILTCLNIILKYYNIMLLIAYYFWQLAKLVNFVNILVTKLEGDYKFFYKLLILNYNNTFLYFLIRNRIKTLLILA